MGGRLPAGDLMSAAMQSEKCGRKYFVSRKRPARLARMKSNLPDTLWTNRTKELETDARAAAHPAAEGGRVPEE